MLLVTFQELSHNCQKKLLLGLLTSPVPVKRNQVEVELFYHQTDNQAKIFYIFEHKKINCECTLGNKNTLASFLRIDSTFLLSYNAWLSNIIFLSCAAYLRKSRPNCCQRYSEYQAYAQISNICTNQNCYPLHLLTPNQIN